MNDAQTTHREDEKTLRDRVAKLIESFRAQRIHLSELPLETVHEGVTLRGRIYYWSKDWFCVLEEPVFAFGPDGHMMALIPARYVAPGQSPGDKIIGRPLPGAEVLVETYKAAIDPKP